MEQKWVVVKSFPNYEVSDQGEIRNRNTGRIMRQVMNQYGVVCVGMMKTGLQFKRSVPLLVAQAFIPRPFPMFDTPINLSGDRHDNTVVNLLWRPRWHALAYNRQFKEPFPEPITVPVRDTGTSKVYDNSWTASLALGLLEKDLVLSILNRTYVWPLYRTFETL